MLKHMTFRAVEDDNRISWVSHTVTLDGGIHPLIELSTSQSKQGLVRMEVQTIKPMDGKDALDMWDMVTYALNCATVDHMLTYPDGSAFTVYLRSFGKIESAQDLVVRIGRIWRSMSGDEEE